VARLDTRYESQTIPSNKAEIKLICIKDVTIAGIKVKDQEIALVDRAYWVGDGVSDNISDNMGVKVTNQILDHLRARWPCLSLPYTRFRWHQWDTRQQEYHRNSTWGSGSLFPDREQHDHARLEPSPVQSEHDQANK
jgi:hypothetical protein